MQNFNFYKNGMHIDFALGDHGELLLQNFSEKPYEGDPRWSAYAVEILTTGANRDGHHGAKQAFYRCLVTVHSNDNITRAGG